jgi:hypothetical protein
MSSYIGAPEDEPGYWDGEVEDECVYQSRKAAKRREVEQEWFFTFGFDHVHPVTGESLANCYTTIMGDIDQTRALMAERFGNKWAFQYPSREAAGVEKYGLKYVEYPDECPF